jgi:hypothetical protein
MRFFVRYSLLSDLYDVTGVPIIFRWAPTGTALQPNSRFQVPLIVTRLGRFGKLITGVGANSQGVPPFYPKEVPRTRRNLSRSWRPHRAVAPIHWAGKFATHAARLHEVELL